jgi:hypothetical protein
MSQDESQPDTSDAALTRKRQTFRYRGGDPVTFITTRLPGAESTREERISAGLRRLAREGRVTPRG